jgi:uncharacterized protein YndB with AHSA1/START domain
MKRNIHIEREYPYSVSTLWQALTTSEHIAEWLMPNDFQPRSEGGTHLHYAPSPLLGSTASSTAR